MRGTFLSGDDVASAAPPVLEDFVVQGGAITLDSMAEYPHIKWGIRCNPHCGRQRSEFRITEHFGWLRLTATAVRGYHPLRLWIRRG